jgi:hypothetical protein
LNAWNSGRAFSVDPAAPAAWWWRSIEAGPMARLVADYLAAARQFERLAFTETRPEAKQLMKEQAETCVRLALKRAKETDRTSPLMLPPVDFIT